jgi:hypothetical protein
MLSVLEAQYRADLVELQSSYERRKQELLDSYLQTRSGAHTYAHPNPTGGAEHRYERRLR